VKNRQDKEKGLLQEKERRIEDLEALLDECKANLLKKKEIQKELEEILRRQELEYNKIVRDKDNEIRELKKRVSEGDEEIKILIKEIERLKKLAKEKLDTLNQIFQ
jgi:Uncharacterized conserved protein